MDEDPALPLRMLRVATYASIPAFAAWVAWGLKTGLFGQGVLRVAPWVGTLTGVLFFAIPATFVTSTALGVRLLPKRLSRAISLGTIRTRFWNSRLGAWTAKVLGGKQRGIPHQLVDRPTEMALGLAASELFTALPKAYRERLRELPAVVRKLEARATTLRKRIEETAGIVDRASEGRSAPAVERLIASHERLKGDLARTVATLESIRLDLLRVHGGAHDLEPLTTLLDAANDVEREIGFLIEAQDEVRAGTTGATGSGT